MASYYVTGYTPPSGVTNSTSVKALQQQLNAGGANLKVDGVWGPKTAAAYGSMGGMGGSSSYIPSSYTSILNELQGILQPSTLSYSGPSRAELEAGLNPLYDQAIIQRKEQTATNKANIDVDAASRGMGTSTWVTDVKDRQQNAESSDIASINAARAAALLDALNANADRQFAADQYNANAQAQALQSALAMSGDFYNMYLSQQGGGSSGGGSSGRSSGKKSDDYAGLVDRALSATGNVYTAAANLGNYASGYSTSAILRAQDVLEAELARFKRAHEAVQR